VCIWEGKFSKEYLFLFYRSHTDEIRSGAAECKLRAMPTQVAANVIETANGEDPTTSAEPVAHGQATDNVSTGLLSMPAVAGSTVMTDDNEHALNKSPEPAPRPLAPADHSLLIPMPELNPKTPLASPTSQNPLLPLSSPRLPAALPLPMTSPEPREESPAPRQWHKSVNSPEQEQPPAAAATQVTPSTTNSIIPLVPDSSDWPSHMVDAYNYFTKETVVMGDGSVVVAKNWGDGWSSCVQLFIEFQ
jgi:hypothetical protein